MLDIQGCLFFGAWILIHYVASTFNRKDSFIVAKGMKHVKCSRKLGGLSRSASAPSLTGDHFTVGSSSTNPHQKPRHQTGPLVSLSSPVLSFSSLDNMSKF